MPARLQSPELERRLRDDNLGVHVERHGTSVDKAHMAAATAGNNAYLGTCPSITIGRIDSECAATGVMTHTSTWAAVMGTSDRKVICRASCRGGNNQPVGTIVGKQSTVDAHMCRYIDAVSSLCQRHLVELVLPDIIRQLRDGDVRETALLDAEAVAGII